MDRTGFIGGSDVGAIMGASPYTTPYQLWLVKTGRKDSFVGNDATYWGTMLENAVLDHWCLEHPDLAEGSQRQVNYTKKFLSGTADLVCDRMIVDAKTTSRKWSSVPDDYYWQMQFYMYLAGKKEAMLAVLRSGIDYHEELIVANPTDQNDMLAGIEAFWALVQSDMPPARQTQDESPDILLLDSDYEAVVDQYMLIKEQKRALDEKEKDLRAQIEFFLGEYVKAEGNGFKLSNTKRTYKSLDTARLSESLKPGIRVEDLYKESTGSVLKITRKENGH